MKIYGNLVTGCHDCPLNYDYSCILNDDIATSNQSFKVPNECPLLKEETHSITIMLSDQYNKL